MIYSIILLFPVPHQPPNKMLDLSILAILQEVGFQVSQSTLDLPEEVSHTRPQWEDWILAGCKRRTLMVLYSFEWINTTLNDLAIKPCMHIKHMLAPTGKVLWGASTREKWQSCYDRWLGRWAGMGNYTIEDLKKTLTIQDLDIRSEMWLAEADEFGLLFMSMVRNSVQPCFYSLLILLVLGTYN
jgi:hypothetical protein